tara:strand:+ start:2528 stop:3376 length:849 start_codon:yes stop_codon:yes gene_type:complete
MIDYFDKITVVLISYKSKKKIKNFLKNISNKNRILIIENSNEKSIKNEVYGQNIKLYFVNNKGYAGSINYARKMVKTEYFFVFNPDVEGINDSIINQFYVTAKNLKDNFACMGPRYSNISSKTLKQSDENKEIDTLPSISGASMFFNIKNFDLIGGFDENFFLYFEETDYCLRSLKQGFKSYQINSIKIKHYVGTSIEYENENEKEKLKNLYIWHFIWSKYYFNRKHYGSFRSIVKFSPILIRTFLKMIYYKITNNNRFEKFNNRYNGLISSIRGKNSSKRI